LNDQSLVQLGYGVHQKRIQATTTVNTNMISVDIAGNKHATKKTSVRRPLKFSKPASALSLASSKSLRKLSLRK